MEETCRAGSEVVETERLETHLGVLEVCRFPERVEQNLGLEEQVYNRGAITYRWGLLKIYSFGLTVLVPLPPEH